MNADGNYPVVNPIIKIDIKEPPAGRRLERPRSMGIEAPSPKGYTSIIATTPKRKSVVSRAIGFFSSNTNANVQQQHRRAPSEPVSSESIKRKATILRTPSGKFKRVAEKSANDGQEKDSMEQSRELV